MEKRSALFAFLWEIIPQNASNQRFDVLFVFTRNKLLNKNRVVGYVKLIDGYLRHIVVSMILVH